MHIMEGMRVKGGLYLSSRGVTGQVGTVITAPDAKGIFTVQFGKRNIAFTTYSSLSGYLSLVLAQSKPIRNWKRH